MRQQQDNLIDWLCQFRHERQGQRYLTPIELFELFRRLELGERIRVLKSPIDSGWDRVHYVGSPRKCFPRQHVDYLAEVPTPGHTGKSLEIACFLIGLHGHTGPLPQSDWDQVAKPDTPAAARAFLQVFENRLIRLYCECWRRGRIDISREYARTSRWVDRESAQRKQLSDGRDSGDFTKDSPPPGHGRDWAEEILQSLNGMVIGGARQPAQAKPDASLPGDLYLGLSAFLCRPVRTVEGLTGGLISQFPGLSARLLEFRRSSNVLPAASRTRLGRKATGMAAGKGAGQHHCLGRTATIGSVFCEHQKKFELRLGPLQPQQVIDFSPHLPGKYYVRLLEFVKSFAGPTLDFDIRYEFEQNTVREIGRTRLSCGTPSPDSPSEGRLPTILGFNSWLYARDPDRGRNEACFRFTWAASANSVSANSGKLSPSRAVDWKLAARPVAADSAGEAERTNQQAS